MFSWGQARKPLAELREKGRGFRGKKEGEGGREGGKMRASHVQVWV
jgi:hypothetical protein